MSEQVSAILDRMERELADCPGDLSYCASKHFSLRAEIRLVRRRPTDGWKPELRSWRGKPEALLVYAAAELSPAAVDVDHVLRQVAVVVLDAVNYRHPADPNSGVYDRSLGEESERMWPWLEYVRTHALPGTEMIWEDEAGLHRERVGRRE